MPLKRKGNNMALTKRQANAMARHKEHHTAKHMK